MEALFFTDKKEVGLDEWMQEVINNGKRPSTEPKQIIRCKGYLERLAKSGIKAKSSGLGLMARDSI